MNLYKFRVQRFVYLFDGEKKERLISKSICLKGLILNTYINKRKKITSNEMSETSKKKLFFNKKVFLGIYRLFSRN